MIDPALRQSHANAAMTFGACALLVTGLQPILLGAMITNGFISLPEAGLLAMIEVFCIGLGAGIAPAIMPLKYIRTLCVTACVGLIFSNYLTIVASDISHVLSIRAFSGLCSGVILWTVTTTFVRMSMPDRRAGILLVVSTFAQAVVAALFALVVVPNYGWKGCFIFMSACCVIPLLFSRKLAFDLRPLRIPNSEKTRLNVTHVFASLVVVFHICAIGSIWAFLEPLGQQVGISARIVALTVAFTLLAQMIGGSLGSWLSPTSSARAVIATVAVLHLLIAIVLSSEFAASSFVFVTFTIAFGALWLFLLPFQFRLALIIDPSGRLATVVPALQLLGSAFGPLCVSLFIDDKPSRAALAAAAFLMLALLTLVFTRSHPRSKT